MPRTTRFYLTLFVLFQPALLLAEQRPNIIVLLADDQCKYSMGCYDTPGAQTPNLDRLARDGMVFDRHYDTTAICMASRATLMTGMFEYKTGCNFDSGPLLNENWQRSYPMLLKAAGYKIAMAGKFGFEVAQQPGEKGILPETDFDWWGGGPGQTSYETLRNASMQKYADRYPHSTLSYGAFAQDVIRAAAEDKATPFCLSISFKAPHQPVTPDPRFDEVFRGARFEKPANFGREHGGHFSPQSRLGRQYDRFHSWDYSTDYDQVMASYYQQIYAIDYVAGWIRQVLLDTELAENTVIIYTSDNGFLCGSHGYGSKVLPYEEASCVPLIVCDPRRPVAEEQSRCDALTGNVDIAPTVLALAGVPVPSHMDGGNLLDLLEDPASDLHEYLPLINVWGPKQVHSFAVVTTAHKLIYWPYAGDGLQATWELYDMQRDRLELQELSRVSEASQALAAMRDVYARGLEHWTQQGVQYHGYERFTTIFDASASWEVKQQLYGGR